MFKDWKSSLKEVIIPKRLKKYLQIYSFLSSLSNDEREDRRYRKKRVKDSVCSKLEISEKIFVCKFPFIPTIEGRNEFQGQFMCLWFTHLIHKNCFKYRILIFRHLYENFTPLLLYTCSVCYQPFLKFSKCKKSTFCHYNTFWNKLLWFMTIKQLNFNCKQSWELRNIAEYCRNFFTEEKFAKKKIIHNFFLLLFPTNIVRKLRNFHLVWLFNYTLYILPEISANSSL